MLLKSNLGVQQTGLIGGFVKRLSLSKVAEQSVTRTHIHNTYSLPNLRIELSYSVCTRQTFTTRDQCYKTFLSVIYGLL